MTFEALTSIAESIDIITFFDRLICKKAFSIHENKQTAIIIDTVQLETERETKTNIRRRTRSLRNSSLLPVPILRRAS